MVIGDQKAAKIQELLKQLSSADTFQSVAITREIRDIAHTGAQFIEYVRIHRRES